MTTFMATISAIVYWVFFFGPAIDKHHLKIAKARAIKSKKRHQ